MISEKTITNRAAGGARFLDEIDHDWYQRVDSDLLDMSIAWMGTDQKCGCILAQLHGRHFQDGLRLYRISHMESATLGFTLNSPDFDFTGQWDKLTAAWREEILSRHTQEET